MKSPFANLFPKLTAQYDGRFSAASAAPQPKAPPAAGRPSITTDIGGTHYVLAGDDHALRAIGRTFKPELVRLIDTLIRPGDVVFDVGAGVGCTAILFGDRARMVCSFEPAADAFKFLSGNVLVAGRHNVRPFNFGLARTASGHEQAPKMVVGDAFVDDMAIDQVHVIKIDAAGAERNILDGLTATLRRDRPLVLLEPRGAVLPELLDHLRALFPYLYAVGPGSVLDLHANGPDSEAEASTLVGAFDPSRLDQFAATYDLMLGETSAA